MRLVANRKLRQRDHVAELRLLRVLRHRTTADCRRRCRGRSGGCCRASPRGTTARRVWPIFMPMRWRSASRPSSVIFGKARVRMVVSSTFAACCLSLAQDLAVDLAGRRLGQLGHELDDWRGYSCWLRRARTRSWISSTKRVVARAIGDDERLHHLAAQRVGHADRADLAHVGMLQDRVLDLDRAHRPAGRDDDVVGAAAVDRSSRPRRCGRDPWWRSSCRAATPSSRR